YYQKGEFAVAADPGELPGSPRSRFFDDGDGGVVLNAGHRPYRFSDGKFTPFRLRGIPENASLILQDGNELWFREGSGIYRRQGEKIERFSIAATKSGNVYEAAFKDSTGAVWAAFFETDNFTLVRIKNGRVERIALDQPVNHFAEDGRGNLWLSVFSRGLYRIDRADVVQETLPPGAVEHVIEIDGISTNASGHLIFDDEGGLWLGTEKGLNRVSPQLVHVFSKADGLLNENIYPIMADGDGSVWAGVWPNNLVKYESGKFRTWISDETVLVTSLFDAGGGKLWYGSIGDVYIRENDRSVKSTAESGFPQGTEFSAITRDGNGTMWFGTSRGLGSYKDGRSAVYTTADGLPDDYVVALLAATDGRLWIGTRGGLAVMEKGKLRSYTTDDGLASNSIRSLYEDNEGILWIGSYDGGLTRLRDGTFTVYTVR